MVFRLVRRPIKALIFNLGLAELETTLLMFPGFFSFFSPPLLRMVLFDLLPNNPTLLLANSCSRLGLGLSLRIAVRDFHLQF